MVDAEPFVALRYDPAIAGDASATSAPAYDDVGRFDYARHRTASPYTVLELLAGDPSDEYRTARAAFERWRRTGVLVTEHAPALFLYEIHELRAGVPAVLRGVLASVSLDGGNLLPHEGVDPQRVADRVRRLEAVPADLAPVFAVHTAAPPQLRAILDAPPAARPIVAFTDDAGADHRVWALREPAVLDAVRDGLRTVQAVIADGHHRFAAARAHGASRRTLAYLVDGTAYGPQLRAVHRLVSPFTPAALGRLLQVFDRTPIESAALVHVLGEQTAPAFGLHLADGRCSLLVARDPAALRQSLPATASDAWKSLDTAVFDSVVRPLVPAAEIGYRSDPAAAIADVESNPDAALFLLRPPSLDAVFACATAGEALPPKSTWFRPKPRAGLVMRSLHSRP